MPHPSRLAKLLHLAFVLEIMLLLLTFFGFFELFYSMRGSKEGFCIATGLLREAGVVLLIAFVLNGALFFLKRWRYRKWLQVVFAVSLVVFLVYWFLPVREVFMAWYDGLAYERFVCR